MPTTRSQVLILVAFFIPGFVLVRVKRLSYPPAEESFQRVLLDSLALSRIVHALASPVWYWSYAWGIPMRRPTVFGLMGSCHSLCDSGPVGPRLQPVGGQRGCSVAPASAEYSRAAADRLGLLLPKEAWLLGPGDLEERPSDGRPVWA